MTHDIPPYLRAWLDETLTEAPQPGPLIEAVTTAAHQTAQQRAWLALLETRRSTMFATIMSFAAVATLAVAGGLLFATQESAEPSPVGASVSAAPSPSASPDPMGPAWVSGTLRGGGAGGQVGSESTVDEGKTRSRYLWEDMRLSMSDPRLSGVLHTIYNQDVHSGASGELSQFLIGVGSYRIENESGSWDGPSIFLNEGASGTATVSDDTVLVGSGAYEGLSAFLVFDFRTGAVVGAIFPGDLPPAATFD